MLHWCSFAHCRARDRLKRGPARQAKPYPVLFQCFRAMIEPFRGAHELQQRYREALFGKTPLHKLPFNIAQLGFEQVLIAINVRLMRAQLNNPRCHDGYPTNYFF